MSYEYSENILVQENSGNLNVSEIARVCDMSRTTVYKYVSLLEK